MMVAQQLSLNTFTAVRIISRILSVTSSKPMPSKGKPTAVRITVIATRLAEGMPATPIEVSSAISTMVNCTPMVKSKP